MRNPMETKTLTDPKVALEAALRVAEETAIHAQDAQVRLQQAVRAAVAAGHRVPNTVVCHGLLPGARPESRGTVDTWLDELHRIGFRVAR